MGFKKIVSAKATTKGVPLTDGEYLLEVQGIKFFEGFSGDTFVAELKVLEAKKTDEKIEPAPVGSVRSFVVVLDPKGMGAGNVKAFAMALLGCAEEEIDEDGLEALCSKDQPARFLKTRDSAFTRPQKVDKNKSFTHHRWEHVATSDEEITAIKARRAAEDKPEAA